MKTLLIAIVASVMLAATAQAQSAQSTTCDGMLVEEGYRLYIASFLPNDSCMLLKGKGDWYSERRSKRVDTVLSVCTPGHFCRIRAITQPCEGGRDVKRVLSVRKSVDPYQHEAATAHAQEPITCEGILRQDGDRLFMAAQEGVEGICEFVNPLARWKVQAACRIDRWCRVYGNDKPCEDSGECSEITRVLSAVPLSSHPRVRLRAWQR
jgi:hypothetical protein